MHDVTIGLSFAQFITSGIF